MTSWHSEAHTGASHCCPGIHDGVDSNLTIEIVRLALSQLTAVCQRKSFFCARSPIARLMFVVVAYILLLGCVFQMGIA